MKAEEIRIPLGFRFASTKAQIKRDRRDLALIVSDTPATAAGAFTVNAVAAAPVCHAAKRLPVTGIRAIVANSGNANALTGPVGAEDERAVAAAVGSALGGTADEVLTASTGAIGIRLPVERIQQAVPALVAGLGSDIGAAAEAIRTTDLTTKMSGRTLELGGKTVSIAAIAKGSGMIHPQMATMLCFVTTDAALSPAMLDRAVTQAADDSFNTITVDGDMSTNDSVIVLANGRAGAPLIEGPGPDFDRFTSALTEICTDLARAIAADGEGATKLVIVDVEGATDRATARLLARSVAGSDLTKAGLFGGDPSWGRILAALGARVGAEKLAFDAGRVRLTVQGTVVYEKGAPKPFDTAALSARMKEPEIAIRIELGMGEGRARSFGCDLSFDYVKINAEYYSGPSAATSNAVVATEPAKGTGVGVNRGLVVEALSYIRKFAGKRAVIKYGGAAMIDPALKRSFAEEVVLLQSAGLRVVIVHGGGPEITRTLEKLGQKSQFADGQRITGPEDIRVVEMVLTGKVNTEIVGLLGTLGGKAVGLSGKDGRLLSARKLMPAPGKPDLGLVGEIESVNSELLDMFLDKGYIPVISPVGLGADGTSYNINADVAASAVAVAAGASRLIFLTDVPGILDESGKLVSEIGAADLQARLGGSIKGGMHVKAQAVLSALTGGVQAVHVVDGRQPHSIVAELFTDRGVGTLIT